MIAIPLYEEPCCETPWADAGIGDRESAIRITITIRIHLGTARCTYGSEVRPWLVLRRDRVDRWGGEEYGARKRV